MGCNCKPIKVAATAAKATARVVQAAITGRDVAVDDPVFAARMEICRSCPHVKVVIKHGAEFHRCTICTCWLDGKYLAKARLATETCPEGHWA